MLKLGFCNLCNPLCHLCTSRNLDTFKAWKSDFATFCNLCNLRNTNIFKCFHNITQMRPLILKYHGHLFKTLKSDLQVLHLFKIYNLDIFNPIWTGPPANPKKLRRGGGGGQNGISSLIGYFKVTMKLEKSFDDVIAISMLWSHHRFDV